MFVFIFARIQYCAILFTHLFGTCRHTDTQTPEWKKYFMTFCDFKCFFREKFKMPMRLPFKKLLPYTPLHVCFFSLPFQSFLPFFIGKLWWWLLLHFIDSLLSMDNVLVHFLRGAACCEEALHEKDVHQIYQSIIPLLLIIYWLLGDFWVDCVEFDCCLDSFYDLETIFM